MKLVRWNPVHDIVSSFNRDLDPFFNDGFFGDRWFRFPMTRSGERGWTPLVDVEETDSEVLFRAELPGMNKDDIELSIENNVLTLRGEKKEERRNGDKESDLYRSERFFGRFERSFSLPTATVAEKAKAEFKDGILTISLPKKEEAKSRKITIN
jgi:HSP20 family protein